MKEDPAETDKMEREKKATAERSYGTGQLGMVNYPGGYSKPPQEKPGTATYQTAGGRDQLGESWIPIEAAVPYSVAANMKRAFEARGVAAAITELGGRQGGSFRVFVHRTDEAEANRVYPTVAHASREAYMGKKATDRRTRLHRALDRVMDAAEGKLLGIGNGFEYWQVGEEVYRNQVGNRGPMEGGKPSNARWECGIAHYDRYKESVLGVKATDGALRGLSQEQGFEVVKHADKILYAAMSEGFTQAKAQELANTAAKKKAAELRRLNESDNSDTTDAAESA